MTGSVDVRTDSTSHGPGAFRGPATGSATELTSVATPLPRVRSLRICAAVLAASAVLSLSACGIAPVEPESERLDPNTGTTVTVMPKPVELIVDRTSGTKTDPFAYVAPFETNRMGSHELFLWVTAPQVAGELAVPQVYCGDQLIALERYQGTMADVGLSSPPYKVPAPWSAQWYFKLSGEVLDCFAAASHLRIITQAGDEDPQHFNADGPNALSGLGDFAKRVRT